MRALALSLAGALAVLSGGLLIVTGGPAQSDPARDNRSTSVALDDACVPVEAKTEQTGWVTASPGNGWYLVESRTVTDEEATSESSGWLTIPPPGEGWKQVDTRTVDGVLEEESHWQRYSWVGGPLEGKPTVVPADDPDEKFWQSNVEGDPHDVGVEGAYDRSNVHSGKADWFYLEWVDATYEQVTQFLYERPVAPVTHEEFVFAFDRPSVECPVAPTVPVVPTVPTEQPVPTVPTEQPVPTVPSGPTVLGDEATASVDPTEPTVKDDEAAVPSNAAPSNAADVEVLGEQATKPKHAVPKAVDAGASGWTGTEVMGIGLVGSGALLLLAATGALLGARRLEVS